MKRILFLESRFNSYFGAQKSMVKLIKSLDNNQFDYEVVTTDNGKLEQGLKKEELKVNVVKLGRKANVFGGKVLTYSFFSKLMVAIEILLFNLKILKFIRNKKIDVIYVNDLRAMLYSVIAGKILRKKIVWYIRSDVSPTKLTRFGLFSSDTIITIANGVLKELPSDLKDKYKHKIKNIYTGFDFEEFSYEDKNIAKKKLGIKPGNITVGYLGSINERKGIDLLIKAMVNISKECNNYELLITGEISSGYEEYWDQQLKVIGESNLNFKLIKYTDDISLPLNAMDIFVLPSRAEGLPRVVIEAMAHKLPVIATDVGGIREIIVHNSTGLVIKKDDIDSLKKYILKLGSEIKTRNSLGNEGRKHCLITFNSSKFAKEINKLFKSITA